MKAMAEVSPAESQASQQSEDPAEPSAIKDEKVAGEASVMSATQEDGLKKKRARGTASGSTKRGGSMLHGKHEMSWREAIGHALAESQIQGAMAGTLVLASMAIAKAVVQ